MSILFVFLSGILFLDCIVLILLVLLQLPKKEAGAGMAFGGSATDALFGAGSGNALTTITKYSAGVFFGAALLMSIIGSHRVPAGGSALLNALAKPGASSGPVAPPLMPAASSNSDLRMGPGPLAPIPAPASSSAPAAPPAAAGPPAPPAPAPAGPPAAAPVAPPVAPRAAPAPTPGPSTNR